MGERASLHALPPAYVMVPKLRDLMNSDEESSGTIDRNTACYGILSRKCGATQYNKIQLRATSWYYDDSGSRTLFDKHFHDTGSTRNDTSTYSCNSATDLCDDEEGHSACLRRSEVATLTDASTGSLFDGSNRNANDLNSEGIDLRSDCMRGLTRDTLTISTGTGESLSSKQEPHCREGLRAGCEVFIHMMKSKKMAPTLTKQLEGWKPSFEMQVRNFRLFKTFLPRIV